jgi:Asp/Glu/hydantoin racemase
MSRQRIVVVNPNSTLAVTAGIDEALEPLRSVDGPEIVCRTMAEGPPGIETQAHVDGVTAPLLRLMAREEERGGGASAFVIACFSDPGLHAARETVRAPVFGIAECAFLTAMTLGERFGVIAILARSLPRHRRYLRALGIEARLAGELPVGLGVVELDREEVVTERLVRAGRRLRDEHGAASVILGCAGMARYRGRLEEAIGLPVVDPTQAAVGMAVTALRLGYGPRRGPGGPE